jgi:hypothetical protein
MRFISARRGVIGTEGGYWIVDFVSAKDKNTWFQVRINKVKPLADLYENGIVYSYDDFFKEKFTLQFENILANIAKSTIDGFIMPIYTLDSITGDYVYISAHSFSYRQGINENMSVLEMEPFMLYDIKVSINIHLEDIDSGKLTKNAFQFIDAIRASNFSPDYIQFSYRVSSRDGSINFKNVHVSDWQVISLLELRQLFEDSFNPV